MRLLCALLLLIASPAAAQQSAPAFLYIYRDSIKAGVDSAYRAIENAGAQICADFRCPNPYVGIESLTGPHEAWWINAFDGPADTARVAAVYRTNRPLAEALRAIAGRKAALIGTPVQGFAMRRRDLGRGGSWSLVGARYMVVSVTRDHPRLVAAVWAMADATLYALRPVRTRQAADALARASGGRVFAIRPTWSMPAPQWLAADPAFWRLAPVRKSAPR